MPDVVKACPECGSAELGPRSRSEHNWYCRGCGHKFNEPDERPRRSRSSDPDLAPRLSKAGQAALAIGRGEEADP